MTRDVMVHKIHNLVCTLVLGSEFVTSLVEFRCAAVGKQKQPADSCFKLIYGLTACKVNSN